MNILLILLALILLVIASLTVIALGGHRAVPGEGPRAVQEEPEPLPLAVPHTGNVERTLSAHDFVDHHVDKPSGASAVSSAEKPQSGEAR